MSYSVVWRMYVASYFLLMQPGGKTLTAYPERHRPERPPGAVLLERWH
jgi:hypothetical protein